jgi:hypothetical protein
MITTLFVFSLALQHDIIESIMFVFVLVSFWAGGGTGQRGE